MLGKRSGLSLRVGCPYPKWDCVANKHISTLRQEVSLRESLKVKVVQPLSLLSVSSAAEFDLWRPSVEPCQQSVTLIVQL